MFLDLGDKPADAQLRAAVCIIGGGVAGLTIAMALEEAGIDSIVLESGGWEPEPETDALNHGESRGDIRYGFAEGCRSRFFGGGSNCWAGFCRAFDEDDLAHRPWVPHSGWPLSHADLVPYFRRAHALLKLGPYNYDTRYWTTLIGRRDVQRWPMADSGLTDVVSQFSAPVRFGKRFRQDLQRSQRITVVLHANLTRLDSDADGGRILRAHARSLAGASIDVEAPQFVMAAGGIENVRLLLSASPRHPQGLGNAHDQLGRYFMDHPRIEGGEVHIAPGWRGNRLFDTNLNFHHGAVSAQGTKIAAQWTTTRDTQERLGLTRSVMWINSILPGEHSDQANALIRLKQRLLGKVSISHSVLRDVWTLLEAPRVSSQFIASRTFPHWMDVARAQLCTIVEPVPNPDSRIVLSEQRDALGMPRVCIEWRVGSQERHTFDTNHRLLRDWMEGQGLAKVHATPPLGASGPWPDTFIREGTWHHMGGARMDANPRQGVVDTDCRVHGVANLFVAGSAVFRTGGANYPTINLTALALRLADKLVSDARVSPVRA